MMTKRNELLVSALPVMLTVERGAHDRELRVVVEGFDPIIVGELEKIILRPEGHAVIIERAWE